MSADRWEGLTRELRSIEEAGLFRRERLLACSGTHPEVEIDGRRVIDFSSNHYLGLGRHPEVVGALCEATREYGAGGLASRLIGGTMPPHRAFEEEVARFKGTEDAVLFGSGFLANQGALSALCGPQDLIVSDALNHASLIEGCRLSRARVEVVPHRDVAAFEEALARYGKGARRRLVVTDAVFSMDGDEAPLEELSSLCARYDAFLYVDEAHATGVYGPQGRGLAAARGVEPDISMGTLGKALGCVGAYIAGRRELCTFLRNRARTYIFTTSLPPGVAAAARAAVRVCAAAEDRRAALWRNVARFREGLEGLGFAIPEGSRSQIVPLLVGDPLRTVEISRELLGRGVFVHGVRPPTVPPGTSRLRFTLLATHTEEHIARALQALSDIKHLF